MQSKATRGVRHLLVSTGVISLLLSVAAPAALANGLGNANRGGQGAAGSEGVETEREPLAGPVSTDGSMMWVCHPTSSPTNPFVGIWVSVNAEAQVETNEGLDLVECPADVPPTGLPAGTGGSLPGVGNGGSVPGGGDGGSLPGGGIGGSVPGVGNGNGNGNRGTDDTELDDSGETVIVVDPGTGTPHGDDGVAVGDPPAGPAHPLPPAAQPRPVVIISDDAVTRPVTPAAPALTPTAQNEVLGAVTTRIPTGTSSVDASVQTAGNITALAATGAGTTWMLVTVGLVLLFAGLGLQVSARRRVRSADVGT